MPNVQIETRVNDLGNIFCCIDSAFDDASKAVLKKSTELISARDLAYTTIQDAKTKSDRRDIPLMYSSFVKEGSLFVPNAVNRRIWLRESLVLQNPSDAVKAHSQNNEYFPENFKIEEYLEKIGKDNYLILSNDVYAEIIIGVKGYRGGNSFSIPTHRFGEDDRTVWLFKDQAKEYGELLNGLGINYIDTSMYGGRYNTYRQIDCQKAPFANQLLIGSSMNTFGNVSICGDHKSLSLTHFAFPVRGVSCEPSESSASKIAELYSPK